MTDKKIVYALRCCAQDWNCFECGSRCPYFNVGNHCEDKLESDAADLIERLSEELEQVKRERDAAIRDARRGGHCVKCKHWGTKRCLDCCYSFGVGENDNWEWRGVVKENAENSGGDADAENRT